MTTLRTCPNCGTRLAHDGPAGNCPNCLFALAAALAPEAVPRSAGLRPGAFSSHQQAGSETGAPPSPAPSVLHSFGDYELLEEIARGGMGVVYRSRQVSLNRIVAVKVLLFGQFASDEFVQRFRTEAEAAANLHHPNIVAIHEIDEHDGRQYFSMDYIEGGHLGDLARDQPMSAKRAAALLKTIAEAVHYAHQRGVLHRDLKPSNILIDTQGQPRLTDFGLAKRVESGALPDAGPPLNPQLKPLSTDLTLTGQMLGTPNYASPEQAGGRRGAATAASDVYSLGAILYFLLAGRPPFLGESLEQTLDRVLHDEPVPPHLLNPSVPRDLETICLKCLVKEPARRYATAHDLADELGRFLNDQPILARPAGPTEKLWRWCRRKPALATAIVALLLVAATGLAGILWQWGRAERNAASETAQRLRAEEAVTMLELQLAEDLLEKDETVMGVAHLSRIVRQQPSNHIAAQRLVSALTQRDFVLPVGPPLQHGKKVNHAEFSPNGRWVVTASLDNTARLWDARSGQPAGVSLLHSNAVRYAHFSPDGQRLVTVSDDSAAQLWEATTGRRIGRPLRHEKRVRDAQFSPDGRQVVTASDDQTARLWDAHTGEPSLAPLRHAGPVSRAGFSPNSRWIVTISGNAAFLWDAQSGLPVGKPLKHGDQVKAAQFSPDSRWVVAASFDGSARVWEVATGEPLTEPLRHKARVSWAEFSPDGERVATASDDGTARLWDARTGEPLTAPLAHGSKAATAQFSPDGQRLLTGFPENAMRVWDAQTGRILAAPIQHDGLIWSACFSPDGQFVVTASADATARIWDIRPGRALNVPLIHTHEVHNLAFSSDDEWLATASLNKIARIWSVRTGRPRTPPLLHGGFVSGVAFSPDGQQLLSWSHDGTARLWDARTGQPLAEPLRHDGPVDWAEFSPDGKWFLTGSVNKAIRLWDARTAQLHSELIRRRDVIALAHFSPDSQTVAFCLSDDDSVRIVDIPTGKPRVELRGHGGFVLEAEFSLDGRRVATASEDSTARIWDATTGKVLTPPLNHKAMVWSARFSPDGLWVVTASVDKTVRVWDVQTGRALTEPLRHHRQVHRAYFSPDGQQVVTASGDGVARLWDARRGLPLAEPFRHADSAVAIFSHDGQRVATASHDGTARIWELPPTVAAGILPAVEPGVPPGGTGVERSRAFATLQPSPGGRMPPSTARGTPAATLADLAEAVIGQRLGESGSLEPFSSHHLVELRQQLSRQPPTNAFTRWLAWFLADRSTRTISPNSTITVPEYIERLIEEKTVAAASEAVLLAPTNAPALAHLAEMLLASPGSNAPVAVAEAQFLLLRAETLAPNDARVRQSRQRTKIQAK